jgi:beta-glucosidase
VPPESGAYQLGAMADDGVRVYLDGKLIVDAWSQDQPSQISTAMTEVQLDGGRAYDVRIEYFENVRNAIAKFFWSYPGFTEKIKAEAITAAQQADAVVAVLGISPALEGEEMSVNVEGFRGGTAPLTPRERRRICRKAGTGQAHHRCIAQRQRLR